MNLAIGTPAPNFNLLDTDHQSVTLQDFENQWLVLYFYPKDNTPGCTTEAQDFSKCLSEFQQLNSTVVGVSPDDINSHCKFINKHNLTITLLSDIAHQVAELYGVWQLKKFMGKEYMGIVRSTFLINPQGEIAYIWSNVKVKDHAIKVLNKLQELT